MSGPAYSMTLEEKAARRDRIVELYRLGEQPVDISKRFGMTANYVRAVLREAGEEVLEQDRADRVTIWDMDDERRRQAIISRAAKGARAQLSANVVSQQERPVIPADFHNAQNGVLRG